MPDDFSLWEAQLGPQPSSEPRLAYRGFCLSQSGLLMPITFSKFRSWHHYAPGETYEAACNKLTPGYMRGREKWKVDNRHPEGQPVPAKVCGCGFAGVFDVADLHQVAATRPSAAHPNVAHVFAECQFWGRTVVATRGLRAQYMTINAILVGGPGDTHDPGPVAERYDVPLKEAS